MNQVSADSLTPILPAAVEEVLETMFFAAVEPCSSDVPLIGNYMTIVVDFTGSPSGSTCIWIERESARLLAADFLGLESSEVTDECLEQTACELGNMICGSIVSRVESHVAFTLGPPRILFVPVSESPAPPVLFQLDHGVLAVTCKLESA